MFRHLLLAGAAALLPLMPQLASAADTTEPSSALTLVQALEITRQQHPALKAIEAELGIFDQRVDLAKLSPPTRLGLEVENIAGGGELSGLEGAEVTLSLSRVIELGDKAEARAGLASSQNDLRRLELVQQRRDILADAAQRFIDTAIAQTEIAQAEMALTLASDTRKTSQRRADAGAAPATELRRANLRLRDAELSLSLARKKAQSAGRALALAIGQPDSLPGVIAEPLNLPA
ncbi:MAG: TolC family protein, partial [Salinisphaeraceae bacterium]|nr:TolC family protein [Salinisphaeraceae bacterium]